METKCSLEIQKQTVQALRDIVKNNPYMQMLSMEVMELSGQHAKGKMKVGPNLLNPYGSVHGGCLYSLADVISGLAACARGRYCSTVSGNMNYIMPAINTEYVYCSANEVRYGSHLAVYEVQLTDDEGNLLETGTFTFYKLRDEVEIQ